MSRSALILTATVALAFLTLGNPSPLVPIPGPNFEGHVERTGDIQLNRSSFVGEFDPSTIGGIFIRAERWGVAVARTSDTNAPTEFLYNHTVQGSYSTATQFDLDNDGDNEILVGLTDSEVPSIAVFSLGQGFIEVLRLGTSPGTVPCQTSGPYAISAIVLSRNNAGVIEGLIRYGHVDDRFRHVVRVSGSNLFAGSENSFYCGASSAGVGLLDSGPDTLGGTLGKDSFPPPDKNQLRSIAFGGPAPAPGAPLGLIEMGGDYSLLATVASADGVEQFGFVPDALASDAFLFDVRTAPSGNIGYVLLAIADEEFVYRLGVVTFRVPTRTNRNPFANSVYIPGPTLEIPEDSHRVYHNFQLVLQDGGLAARGFFSDLIGNTSHTMSVGIQPGGFGVPQFASAGRIAFEANSLSVIDPIHATSLILSEASGAHGIAYFSMKHQGTHKGRLGRLREGAPVRVTRQDGCSTKNVAGSASTIDWSATRSTTSINHGDRVMNYTVTNTSTNSLTGLVVTPPPQFTISQPLVASLAPGASGNFQLTFVGPNPLAVGSTSGTVSVRSNSALLFQFGVQGQVTSRSLKGMISQIVCSPNLATIESVEALTDATVALE